MAITLTQELEIKKQELLIKRAKRNDLEKMYIDLLKLHFVHKNVTNDILREKLI